MQLHSYNRAVLHQVILETHQVFSSVSSSKACSKIGRKTNSRYIHSAGKRITLVHSTVVFTTRLFTALRCDASYALYCSPCLLFGANTTWPRNGGRDLKHFTENITKHKKSITHMSITIDLTMVGKVNIAEEIESGYRLSIMKHKERVSKNRCTVQNH